ncbi:hypothetical protein C8J56DRAFT_466309 [Mycena floridula]|nr:hypothetical protein C8J56DRAFT_466309 [Mycena floridula]
MLQASLQRCLTLKFLYTFIQSRRGRDSEDWGHHRTRSPQSGNVNVQDPNTVQSGTSESQNMVPLMPGPQLVTAPPQTLQALIEAGAPTRSRRSDAESYKTALTGLLGIGFFGASIAWSTVFSGTRGDLNLISWAASVFVVAAVCAAGGSILVGGPEDIVTRHIVARWTVRILSRLSALHIFAGLTLISCAILILDPGADNPEQRPGRGAVKAAGSYALAVSALALTVSLGVWRRYAHFSWFS